MSREIHVHLLPALFEPSDLAGGTAVVVDILRASTTMTFALQNGAAGVMAFGTVEEAFQLREEQGSACLLGGERGGIKIDGFDLSYSPDDYGPDIVAGKTIGFTTTNGTKALLKCREASRILIGAFVNISAVAKAVLEEQGDVHIVCAGTNGAITGEDVLFAGALAVLLQRSEQWLGHPAAVGEGVGRAVDVDQDSQRRPHYPATSAGCYELLSNSISNATEQFQQYLERRDKRITTERKIVIQEIFGNRTLFTIEDLVDRLKQPRDGKRVSRATVFRTVSQLDAAGLIRSVGAAGSTRTAAGSPSHGGCDSTEIAVSLWRQQCAELKAGSVEAALRMAQGGRNLIKLGYDKDIATAAQCDCLNVVGEVGADGVIRVSGGAQS